ncbi:hypothetical protein EDD16DRAFT_1732029 [Pisolithus croceorrhizus]|nr:hypothetical protein EDD16DRAFT_1732029 [Pisolithus croceorrhizus]KAI6113339.1 hypothetical protein EV401DRAFT_2198729 [Pisolithus croceorrhizus]KAI6150143.1 hypothetical protein EDD17DRAFT_1513614 [Pisolithus thermaeus]
MSFDERITQAGSSNIVQQRSFLQVAATGFTRKVGGTNQSFASLNDDHRSVLTPFVRDLEKEYLHTKKRRRLVVAENAVSTIAPSLREQQGLPFLDLPTLGQGWEGALPKHRLYLSEIKLEALPARLTEVLGAPSALLPTRVPRRESSTVYVEREGEHRGCTYTQLQDGRSFRGADGVKRKALRGIEWTRDHKAQRSPFPDVGFINNGICSEAGPRFQVFFSLEACDQLPKATVASPPEPLPWIPPFICIPNMNETVVSPKSKLKAFCHALRPPIGSNASLLAVAASLGRSRDILPV